MGGGQMKCYLSPDGSYNPIRVLSKTDAEVYAFVNFYSNLTSWVSWSGFSSTVGQLKILGSMAQVPDSLFTMLGYNRGD
jgi:hypothetical protein